MNVDQSDVNEDIINVNGSDNSDFDELNGNGSDNSDLDKFYGNGSDVDGSNTSVEESEIGNIYAN